MRFAQFRTGFSALFLGSVVACASAPAQPTHGRLSDWNDQYPEAARELCGWTSQHRDVSDRILFWQGYNAQLSDQLFTWALTHPHEPVDAFLAGHQTDAGLRELSAQHRAELNQWLDWARRNPEGARALCKRRAAAQSTSRWNAC